MAVMEEARKTGECVVNAAPPNAAGRPRIWHPLAFAAWPVLFLYARNCNDLSPSVVVAPLALVLAVALAVWAVARWIVRDRHRAGLLVSALALWFFSFGPVFDLCAGHVRERFLLIVWVALLVPL